MGVWFPINAANSLFNSPLSLSSGDPRFWGVEGSVDLSIALALPAGAEVLRPAKTRGSQDDKVFLFFGLFLWLCGWRRDGFCVWLPRICVGCRFRVDAEVPDEIGRAHV